MNAFARLVAFGMVALLPLVGGVAAEHDPMPPSDPDMAAFVDGFLGPLGKGDADGALDFMEKHALVKEACVKQRDEWKHKLAMIYGNGGKGLGHDLAGIKRTAPGLCRVFAVADYERGLVLFTFQFCRIGTQWKLMHWNAAGRPEEVEKEVPLQRVVPGRPAPVIEGLDYQAFVSSHLTPLGKGDIDQALDHAEKHAGNVESIASVREEWKRRFAVLYGTSGKAIGHEVAGVQRIGRLACKVYAVAYFEGRAFLFMYQFARFNDTWKLSGFGIRDHFRELEDLVTAEPIAPRPEDK